MFLVRPSIRPSSYFPNYFKLDMNVGTIAVNPVVKALDNIMIDYYRHSNGRAYNMAPETYDLVKIQEILEGLGHKVDCLNEEQKRKLFLRRLEFNKHNNRIQSVSLMAKIFFDGAKVQKGWPYPIEKIGQNNVNKIRLLSPKREQRIIFVRADFQPDEELINEFKYNCSLFLPKYYNIVVGGPKKNIKRKGPTQLRINDQFKILTRRL
jgi:hypothetical protein